MKFKSRTFLALSEAFKDVQKDIQEAGVESLATKQDVLLVKQDIKELELRIDNKFEAVHGELRLIKWMMGFTFAGILSLVLKAFFMP